jgi:hypothetical protein
MHSATKIITCFLAIALIAIPSYAQDYLSRGTYRFEGTCSKTFYKGAAASPACDHFVGVNASEPAKPMFIFPLMNGGQAWFFVTSALISSDGERATYAVNKVYDQALGAEFSYPAGECQMGPGPILRCSVWKDKDRTELARELVFVGSGQWHHRK